MLTIGDFQGGLKLQGHGDTWIFFPIKTEINKIVPSGLLYTFIKIHTYVILGDLGVVEVGGGV